MIVLDTHVLIWWVNGDKSLSNNALKTIKREYDSESGQILISSISTWEISMLVDKNRLTLTMDVGDWIHHISKLKNVRFIPIDNNIAMQSVNLPGEFHPDPADRMITALARHFSAELITADEKIRNYKYVKTLW